MSQIPYVAEPTKSGAIFSNCVETGREPEDCASSVVFVIETVGGQVNSKKVEVIPAPVSGPTTVA